MIDIVLAESSRLWCRACDAAAKAAGWSGEDVMAWILEHECDTPTEEDLAAAIVQNVADRDRRLAVLDEFAERAKGIPVTFDPSRDDTSDEAWSPYEGMDPEKEAALRAKPVRAPESTHEIARRLIAPVPLSEALNLSPAVPEKRSPAVPEVPRA